MLTTTEYRTHWIDAAGLRYEQLHPYVAAQLRPVVNLDEVRSWFDLCRSDQMRRLAFPSYDDSRAFYVEQFLRPDLHEDERERLAPLIATELTDDVPHYAQGGGRDWRTPFVAMRQRWPLPDLGGPVEIINLTPHPISVGDWMMPPSSRIARASEETTEMPALFVAAGDALELAIPTTTTRYTDVVDLPAPQPGVYLVVSMVVPPVAESRGRWTGDLLTPGQQVRDSAGRIVGCRSLVRYAP